MINVSEQKNTTRKNIHITKPSTKKRRKQIKAIKGQEEEGEKTVFFSSPVLL